MRESKTTITRAILTGLNYSGIDRIYQQVGDERGMILMFHNISAAPVSEFAPNSHLTVTPDFLEQVILLLRHRGIDLVSMNEAAERIASPTPGNRFAAFTFDDGYRDNLTEAAPVLQRHEVPYTIFVATGLIDGSSELWWQDIEAIVRNNDRVLIPLGGGGTKELATSSGEEKHAAFEHLLHHLTVTTPEERQLETVQQLANANGVDLHALRTEQMMTWDEVRQIASDPLCTIGAHTKQHHALARLTPELAREDIVSGMRKLETELGERPQHFAYPYGYPAAAGPRDFKLAAELGFKSAVTTRPGMVFANHSNHMTALPRISVNGLYQHMRYFKPLTSGLPTRLNNRWSKVNVV